MCPTTTNRNTAMLSNFVTSSRGPLTENFQRRLHHSYLRQIRRLPFVGCTHHYQPILQSCESGSDSFGLGPWRMWRPHERPGALHDAGDRSDVQAAGAKEEYMRKGSPPLEMRFLDSIHTITSILQYCKSNLSTASTTSSFSLSNQCKSISNHLSNTTLSTQKLCAASASDSRTATRAATGMTTTPFASPPAPADGDATACYGHMRRRSTTSVETCGGLRLHRGDALDLLATNSLASFRCLAVWSRG